MWQKSYLGLLTSCSLMTGLSDSKVLSTFWCCISGMQNQRGNAPYKTNLRCPGTTLFQIWFLFSIPKTTHKALEGTNYLMFMHVALEKWAFQMPLIRIWLKKTSTQSYLLKKLFSLPPPHLKPEETSMPHQFTMEHLTRLYWYIFLMHLTNQNDNLDKLGMAECITQQYLIIMQKIRYSQQLSHLFIVWLLIWKF